MAFDPILADRLRDIFATIGPVRELKMFGGLAFMLHGHMCCCVWGEAVVARLGAEDVAGAIAAGEAQSFSPSGRPAAGLAMVADAASLDDDDLQAWVERAAAFVRTLPPKAIA
jgi:hypothetical protein